MSSVCGTQFLKLKKRVKDRWLKALRSGKYKQCTGELCIEDEETGEKTYCCLGVLTDLYPNRDDYSVWNDNMLDERVIEWAFTKRSMQEKDIDDLKDPLIMKYKSASDCNDSGKSFKKIANLIERNL